MFDASSRFKNKKSLNDVLDPRPCSMPLLFNILLRFRTGKIGLIADIKQAFLQIEVASEHRDLLRFIWFDDVFKSHPELISLRFTRVLFGLTCSPFLLNRTVKSNLLKYTQFTDINMVSNSSGKSWKVLEFEKSPGRVLDFFVVKQSRREISK